MPRSRRPAAALAQLFSAVALTTLGASVALLTPTVGSAQEASAPAAVAPARTRHVGVARVLAIIPGAGHVYAGEGGRALAILGGELAIAAVTGLLMVSDCVADVYAAEAQGECDGGGAAIVGAAAIYGVWGWSIYDAGNAARRTNARNARTLSNIPVTVGMTRRPSASGHDVRALKVGLRFAVR